MKRLGHLGILKEGFLAYISPFMLICQKITKDKKVCVSDFGHNPKIAKMAISLVRDMFFILGSSKCQVLKVMI